MGSAVRRVLKADMGKDGDDRRLGKGGHGQGQVALGHAELAKRVNNWNQPGFGQPGAGADHVGLRHAHVEEPAGKALLEKG